MADGALMANFESDRTKLLEHLDKHDHATTCEGDGSGTKAHEAAERHAADAMDEIDKIRRQAREWVNEQAKQRTG